jgi:two-component system LytT family sensor kinase
MNETSKAASPNWPWIAALWFGFGLIDASDTVFSMRAVGMHHAWVRAFAIQVVSWLPWALVTPSIISLGRRYSPFRTPYYRGAIVHIFFVLVFDLVTEAWVTLLESSFDPWLRVRVADPFIVSWLSRSAYGVVSSLVIYAVILAIALVLGSSQRFALQQAETARLNEQLSKAQLNELRQQMNPHFMFNTLNAVSGLVRDHRNDTAVTMIAGLSDLLRRSARDAQGPQVALVEEVEYLKRYLNIQQVRFGERLRVDIDIPQDLLNALVPNLTLQPLVENAIKHGIERRAQGGSVRVTGLRVNGRLELRVYNDGPSSQTSGESVGEGVGLA